MYNEEEKTILIKLGTSIKNIRKNKGYSQEGFADTVGLHRTYMGGIERGERNISVLNLIAIAKKLEVELSDLYPIKNQNSLVPMLKDESF